MKKFCIWIILFLVFFNFVFIPCSEARPLNNLYNLLSRKNVIKVYVHDVTDSTGVAGADVEKLKTAIENGLRTRMTLNFQLVETQEDADIAIFCDITEFYWTQDDPVDMVGGIGMIIFDAATKTEYIRMQADVKVVDPEKNKLLWEKRLKATLSDDKMVTRKMKGEKLTQEEGLKMVNEQFVKIFMRDCFSKNWANRGRGLLLPRN